MNSISRYRKSDLHSRTRKSAVTKLHAQVLITRIRASSNEEFESACRAKGVSLEKPVRDDAWRDAEGVERCGLEGRKGIFSQSASQMRIHVHDAADCSAYIDYVVNIPAGEHQTQTRKRTANFEPRKCKHENSWSAIKVRKL